jgi:hypothetical protein
LISTWKEFAVPKFSRQIGSASLERVNKRINKFSDDEQISIENLQIS